MSYNIIIRGCSFIPIRDFGERFGLGYGVKLNFTVNNIFKLPFDIGIGIASLNSSGINKEAENHNRLMTLIYFQPPATTFPTNYKKQIIDKTTLLPIFLSLEYKFYIKKIFSIAPRISAGYSYNILWYEKYIFSTIEFPVQRKSWQIEPILMPGIFLNVTLKKMFIIQIYTEYGILFEKDGILDFLSVGAGFGFRI